MKRIILVEDNQDLNDITAEHLQLRQFDVHQVYSGLEFYSAIKDNQFDAAVIDLGLPDQPGTVLIDYAARNTNMAIVVVSAFDQTAKRISCFEAGADTFLAKPADPEELATVLNVLIAKKNKTVASNCEPTIPIANPLIQPQLVESHKTSWQLNSLKRQLISPEGNAIDLNINELKLCYRLALAQGDVLRREHMLETIYKRDDESAAKALDTLIRRLRKKIHDETNGQSPIATAYGVGHSFTDHLVLVR